MPKYKTPAAYREAAKKRLVNGPPDTPSEIDPRLAKQIARIKKYTGLHVRHIPIPKEYRDPEALRKTKLTHWTPTLHQLRSYGLESEAELAAICRAVMDWYLARPEMTKKDMYHRLQFMLGANVNINLVKTMMNTYVDPTEIDNKTPSRWVRRQFNVFMRKEDVDFLGYLSNKRKRNYEESGGNEYIRLIFDIAAGRDTYNALMVLGVDRTVVWLADPVSETYQTYSSSTLTAPELQVLGELQAQCNSLGHLGPAHAYAAEHELLFLGGTIYPAKLRADEPGHKDFTTTP